MTTGLVQLYRMANPKFGYSQAANPRRALTKPSDGNKNDGADNDDNDLIMHVNDVLINSQPANGIERQYVIEEMLGQGTFGQVASCWSSYFGKHVAVKVIKNQPAYYHQARVEIGLLQLLNSRCDPGDKHRIVRMIDYFLYCQHLCLVFEKLDVNLFELLKRNSFRGLSLTLVQLFLRQLLDALTVLRDASIIHCDIKPENILLKSAASGDLKLIDFGSACFEGRTVYSYIQSRFYRSPEVVLGYTYTVAIDMWSFGCVAAELFLGLPLFPGASEHDLMARVDETLGSPPDWLLRCAKHTDKFYHKVVGQQQRGGTASSSGESVRYVRMGAAEFEARNGCKAPAGKRYFPHTSLADIISAYPLKQGLSDEEVVRERMMRESFIDLLVGVLHTDPILRWTPRQARSHPFITGASFLGPHQPSPDPYRPVLLAAPAAASPSGQHQQKPIPRSPSSTHLHHIIPPTATAPATATVIAASYQSHPLSGAITSSYQQAAGYALSTPPGALNHRATAQLPGSSGQPLPQRGHLNLDHRHLTGNGWDNGGGYVSGTAGQMRGAAGLYDAGMLSNAAAAAAAQQQQQAHQQAHAIALAAIQSLQNSPQARHLGSSIPNSHLNSSAAARLGYSHNSHIHLFGTSNDANNTRAFCQLQQQQQHGKQMQQQSRTSSWQDMLLDAQAQAPATIPLGSTPTLAALVQQHQQQQQRRAAAAAAAFTSGSSASAGDVACRPGVGYGSSAGALSSSPLSSAAAAVAAAAAQASACGRQHALPHDDGGRGASLNGVGGGGVVAAGPSFVLGCQGGVGGHHWGSSSGGGTCVMMDTSGGFERGASMSQHSPALNYLATSFQTPPRLKPPPISSYNPLLGAGTATATNGNMASSLRQTWQQQQQASVPVVENALGTSYVHNPVFYHAQQQLSAGHRPVTSQYAQQQQQPNQQQQHQLQQHLVQTVPAVPPTATTSGSSALSDRWDDDCEEDRELNDLLDDGRSAEARLYGCSTCTAATATRHMASPEDDVVGSSPGDWDPHYSDAQLLLPDTQLLLPDGMARGGRRLMAADSSVDLVGEGCHASRVGGTLYDGGGTQGALLRQQYDPLGRGRGDEQQQQSAVAPDPQLLQPPLSLAQPGGVGEQYGMAAGGTVLGHMEAAVGGTDAPTTSSWSHAPRAGVLPCGFNVGYVAGRGAGFGLPQPALNLPSAFNDCWRDMAAMAAGRTGGTVPPAVALAGQERELAGQHQAASAPTQPFGFPGQWNSALLQQQQQALLQQQQQQALLQQQQQQYLQQYLQPDRSE